MMHPDELEEMENQLGWGDPRRCPLHGQIISSRDGLFDGLCGHCEAEADGAADDYDRENQPRTATPEEIARAREEAEADDVFFFRYARRQVGVGECDLGVEPPF